MKPCLGKNHQNLCVLSYPFRCLRTEEKVTCYSHLLFILEISSAKKHRDRQSISPAKVTSGSLLDKFERSGNGGKITEK